MITYTNESGQVVRAEIGSRGADVLARLGYKNEFERAAEDRRKAAGDRLRELGRKKMDEKRRRDAEIWADEIAPSVAVERVAEGVTCITITPAAVAPTLKEDLFK